MISNRNLAFLLLFLLGIIIGSFFGLLPGIENYNMGGELWIQYFFLTIAVYFVSFIVLGYTIQSVRQETRLMGPPDVIRVVAIDDEADILRLIRIKLSKEGFDVSTASDGIEGARKVISEKPDVMIVDVMMPGKDGYEVTSEVRRKLGARAPVIIMLTSKAEEDDMVDGLSSGADDYITKPFSPRELVERINVALIKSSRGSNESQAKQI